MDKWRCKVCGFIYDPEKVIPIAALRRGQHLKISPMTGIALSVKSIKVDL